MAELCAQPQEKNEHFEGAEQDLTDATDNRLVLR